jgi:hypothetical protein
MWGANAHLESWRRAGGELEEESWKRITGEREEREGEIGTQRRKRERESASNAGTGETTD